MIDRSVKIYATGQALSKNGDWVTNLPFFYLPKYLKTILEQKFLPDNKNLSCHNQFRRRQMTLSKCVWSFIRILNPWPFTIIHRKNFGVDSQQISNKIMRTFASFLLAKKFKKIFQNDCWTFFISCLSVQLSCESKLIFNFKTYCKNVSDFIDTITLNNKLSGNKTLLRYSTSNPVPFTETRNFFNRLINTSDKGKTLAIPFDFGFIFSTQ